MSRYRIPRCNPPKDWREVTLHWLPDSPYANIPWIRRFAGRLEEATSDTKIKALKKELERFLQTLQDAGELPEPTESTLDINRALLMGTLGVSDSGLAVADVPGTIAQPDRIGHGVRRRAATPPAEPARRRATGRIIEGTVVNSCLFPTIISALHAELERVDPDTADSGDIRDEMNAWRLRDRSPVDSRDEDEALIQKLIRRLDAVAPVGMRFGPCIIPPLNWREEQNLGWWYTEEGRAERDRHVDEVMGLLGVGPASHPDADYDTVEPPAPRRVEGLPYREPTEREIREALRVPDDFGYSGDRPIGETWALGPAIRNRDSNALENSNADALIRALERVPELEGEWEVTHSGHFAVGWVDHLTFHAIESPDGVDQPTPMFGWLCDWFDGLENDPVADVDAYEDRLIELRLQGIKDVRLHDGEPEADPNETWPRRVLDWFYDNESDLERKTKRFLEDPEQWSPDAADVEAALRSLNLWVPEYRFDVYLEMRGTDQVVLSTNSVRDALAEETVQADVTNMREYGGVPVWEDNNGVAMAVVDNDPQLPRKLLDAGYNVDETEWFWPDAGLPGQEPLPLVPLPPSPLVVEDDDFEEDDDRYAGDGEYGVYWVVHRRGGQYYVGARTDTPHSSDTLFAVDGPYDTLEAADDVGKSAAIEWCLTNNVDFDEDEEN